MPSQGQLTLYYGCMFAGKTTALIKHISELGLKPPEIIVLKPSVDVRSGNSTITTHDGRAHACIIMETDTDIYGHVTPFTRLIALDEAQFFNKVFFSDIRRLMAKGINVVAAGLDKDYLGRPFGLMPLLQSVATEAYHLKAVCNNCGNQEAEYSYRKADNKVLVLIGGENHYEARCKSCFSLTT